MEGHERIRLFAALQLPGETVERLSAWQRAELDGAPDARIVMITSSLLPSAPSPADSRRT